MKPITYYVDKFITLMYIAALAGGVIVCANGTDEAYVNKRAVNIRYVASKDSIDHMTADDFLQGEEKAADREGISEYLDKLKKNGLRDSEDESLDEVPGNGSDVYTVETTEPKEDDDTVVIDRDDWRLMLVNKQNPVPDDFDVDLSGINESLYADRRDGRAHV